MESRFSTLKAELGERFDSPSHAKDKLFEYIEVFYDPRRRHSALEYASPAQYEREKHEQSARFSALETIGRQAWVTSCVAAPSVWRGAPD